MWTWNQPCLVRQYLTIILDKYSLLDEVRTGCYRNLFHPDQLISGCEDAANNYARGHFTVGRKVIDQCVNQIRKVAHSCSYVQGFIIIDSMAGGTGSGFSTLLSERLSIEYTKRSKFQVAIYPAPRLETCVVSPYNSVMNTHSSIDFIELSVIMDNEALYEMCTDCLLIQRPTLNNTNRLIAQVIFGNYLYEIDFRNNVTLGNVIEFILLLGYEVLDLHLSDYNRYIQ